jgi:hypothetical protein
MRRLRAGPEPSARFGGVVVYEGLGTFDVVARLAFKAVATASPRTTLP